MRFILIVAMVIVLQVGYSFADPPERTGVKLPAYQGKQLYEVDESGVGKRIGRDRKITGKFTNLTIMVPKNFGKDDNMIPESVQDAIQELKIMLPEHYFLFIIRRHGLIDDTENKYDHRVLNYDFDDRISDLEVFLHEVWKLDDPTHTLSQQIECLGNYQYDLTPFFMLVTMEEMFKRNGDMLAEMREAKILTTTLKEKCL